MFLPIGLSGVWNWRGRIGKDTDETGTCVDQIGPIPDLDRVEWRDRLVTIVFDPDVSSNLSVSNARDQLTRELNGRGARVHWFQWPKDIPDSVKGIDDYLAACGPDAVLRRLVAAKPQHKRKSAVVQHRKQLSDGADSQLILNERGVLRPIVTNAIVLIQHSPEWVDVLAYDEFSMRIMVDRRTPWDSKPDIWTPHDDSPVQEWLQRAGVYVGLDITIQALEHVAKLRPVHPVRAYLNGLNWDGQERLDSWLSTYLGGEDTPYVRYTDEIADLGSKDSSMHQGSARIRRAVDFPMPLIVSDLLMVSA